MVQAHFGDIRQVIIEQLKAAKYQIYVVVAWFTDSSIFQILLDKLDKGIDVNLVLVEDTINQGNGFNYELFTKKGGVLHWDNHHHKYCVIDRETVITGSYNWTYAANNRTSRENVLVIKEEPDLVASYSDEFLFLKSQGKRYELPPKIVEVIRREEVVRVVERPVEIEIVVEVPVEVPVDRPILTLVDRIVTTYTIYEKHGKYICGKCHSDEITEHPKAPRKIQNVVGFYCEKCNIYYDNLKNSIERSRYAN